MNVNSNLKFWFTAPTHCAERVASRRWTHLCHPPSAASNSSPLDQVLGDELEFVAAQNQSLFAAHRADGQSVVAQGPIQFAFNLGMDHRVSLRTFDLSKHTQTKAKRTIGESSEISTQILSDTKVSDLEYELQSPRTQVLEPSVIGSILTWQEHNIKAKEV